MVRSCEYNASPLLVDLPCFFRSGCAFKICYVFGIYRLVVASKVFIAAVCKWYMKKKRRVLPILGYSVALVVVVVLGYYGYVFSRSEAEIEGITVCESADVCYRTVHVHADVIIDVCGEQMRLPLEKGPLDGPHTHKERNKIHFHSKLRIDPRTEAFLETEPLRLGRFMDVMNVRFNKECFGESCNGMTCNGQPGELSMQVNGLDDTEFDQYVWKDGDQIVMQFA